jgi:hypothetical protein
MRMRPLVASFAVMFFLCQHVLPLQACSCSNERMCQRKLHLSHQVAYFSGFCSNILPFIWLYSNRILPTKLQVQIAFAHQTTRAD